MAPTRIIAFTALCLAAQLAHGQQISITSGSATSCSGVIEDSGGPSLEYSDNENITFTICPDIPGNVIYLTWFVFDLSTQGNNDDNLTIYDGDNTGATLLGSYTGTQLQNLIVSGTVFNTTGCLTLVFQSNGIGTGNFSCGFQCTTPCEHPTAAAVMSEAVPALICQGENVQFDGSASFPAPGFTINQYLWDFHDGSVDSTSGPLVNHTFTTAGEHMVQLYLTDDNDCRSLNLVDLQVLVSTTPSFATTSESTSTCFGETVNFTGVVHPITWTGIPDANYGDGVYLPDDVGQPFTSELLFQQFDPGQTVTTTTNIQSICVDMEHTYMGDLVLQVICPNGQTTIFHQQGGGYTFIGGANDTDDNLNPVPGECWHYCFSPTATNGTWVDNSLLGGTPNTILGGNPQQECLTPGTYESVQPFSNLIGCPLNGTWTFQSTDLWGLDNGFLCGWEINFDPSIIPDVTQFTPSIGPDADSSFWTGPNITTISANADTISITAPAPGIYQYQYNVIDNFECPYDTTITLTVNEPLQVDAGPDGVICSDPLQLNATIAGIQQNCDWSLQLNSTFGDGWGGATITVNVNGSPSSYTLNFGAQTTFTIAVQSGDVISLTYGSSFNDYENSYTLFDDQGNTVFTDGVNPGIGIVWNGTANCGGLPDMTWEWTPTTGLSDPTIPDPTVLVTSQTQYTVTAYPTGHPVCATTDSVTITLDPGLDPGLDTLVVICMSAPNFELIDMLGGTPAAGGVWTDANGNPATTTFHPMTDAAGVFTYTVTTVLGCVGTADLTIQLLPLTDPSCCGIVDAGPDSLICTLTYGLNATIANAGDGIWSGPPGCVFSDPLDPQSTVTSPGSGARKLYWTEDDGVLCHLVDSVTITFTEPIVVAMNHVDAICFQACDGTAHAVVTGGNIGNGQSYTYNWSDGLAGAASPDAAAICAGDYSISVADTNACSTSVNFSISEPVLLEIDAITYAEPWCHGACDGAITITDAEAIDFSFDGGQTYLLNGTRTDVCTGNYDLTIHNAAGCVGTGQVNVPEPPEVIAEYSYQPIPANVNAPTIFFNNQSQNATTYLWDIAGLMSTQEPDPVFTFSNKYPGTYKVCLTSFDPHGCTDTICHDVVIDDVLFTYAPNSFTPDGDHVNDTWMMTSNIPDIEQFELQVFDRWGEVVFATTNPLEAWKGGFQNSGAVLKSDVYAYRITFRIISTKGTRQYMGHVTLLK